MQGWIHNDKEILSIEDFPEGTIGFVYLITNKINNEKYIGKKILQLSRKKLVGKRNKHYKVESDWQKYFGSSEELKADLKSFGKENFERKILHFCDTKSIMSYKEMREIFVNDALIDQSYKNHWVSCRINRKNLRGIFINGCQHQRAIESREC